MDKHSSLLRAFLNYDRKSFITLGPALVSMCKGNTKVGSITVLLSSCFTGLDKSVLQIKTSIVSCHTDESKPVKQEVNGTVILPPLVFPDV
jgi:hypothetical protein